MSRLRESQTEVHDPSIGHMLERLTSEFHVELGDIEILGDSVGSAHWIDRGLGVTLVAQHRVFPLDLGDARRPRLRAELEMETRRSFEREHRRLSTADRPAEGFEPQPPRTSDPAWSPIVEFELLERDGGRILRCLHRLTYQPGHEVIVGSLRWPLADGHLALDILHRASMTGLRETVLAQSVLAKRNPEVDPFELVFEQASFDAAEHDELFPDHGLPAVRQALVRWLDGTRGGVRITQPPSFPRSGERILLPGCSSAIELPVGFLPVPAERAPHLSPTIAMLARVGLEPRPTALLDIWRVPDESPRDASELVALAESTTREWVDAGVDRVDLQSEIVASTTHRAQVRCQIDFEVDGAPVLGLAHWLLTHDGAVFRFSVSIEPPERLEDIAPTLDAMLHSWERLPDPEPPPKTRWWQRLFS